MEAGKLRHRVELHSSSPSQNDYGEQTESYSSYTTVWAEIEPLSGRELEHAQQISAETNHRITIRYNSSVATEHRAIYDSRTFEITSVVNSDERNEYLELYCKEIS